MAVTPPLRYIHIDDYGPVGIDNGPDDAAFANARADLAAYGYHTLVIGQKQYWLQNGFNLNSYTDNSGNFYPALPHVLITSDSAVGARTQAKGIFSGLPATIVLSPGFADPTHNCYVGGSEPCRTTGSIQLSDSCGITNVRIISYAAYQHSMTVANGLNTFFLADALVCSPIASMAVPAGNAQGMFGVSAGGGTAVQMDGNWCYVDNLVFLGFRNGVVCVPQLSGGGSGTAPRIGTLRGDSANLVRIDNSDEAGDITGWIKFKSLLTEDLNLPTADVSLTAVSDGLGGTNLTFSTTDTKSTPLGNVLSGAPLGIVLTTPDSDAIYNAYNVANLSPSGYPTNQFTAFATGPVLSTFPTATLSLNLPGIPLDSFFDSTAGTSASGTGSISGTNLTITAINGTVSANDLVTGLGIPPGTSISPTASAGGAGTYGITVPLSTGVEVIDAFSGASFVGSIAGTALTTSGHIYGSLATGQILTGAGLPAGVFITGGSGSSWSVNGTFTIPEENIFSFESSDTFVGYINGTTLDITVGSAVAGQLLYTGNVSVSETILAGSFIATVSGSSGTTNVFQSVGTPQQPVAMTLFPTGASLGSISGASISGNKLTSVGTSLPGSVAGQIVLSNSVPPSGFLTHYSSGIGTLSVASIDPASPLQTVVTAPGASFEGALSNGILTVSSVANPGTLSAGLSNVLFGGQVAPATYLASSLSSTLVQGYYGVEVAQVAPSQTLALVNSGKFYGSISGTVLTPTYAGILQPNQIIFVPSSAGSMTTATIAAVTSVSSSGSATYSLSGTIPPAGTFMVSAPSLSAFGTGSCGSSGTPSATLTFSATTGTPVVGQSVVAGGISQQTYITKVISSGTYTISQPCYLATGTQIMTSGPPSASFLGSTSGATLTVQSVSSGAVITGQALSWPGSGGTFYYIVETLSGSAGVTYILNEAPVPAVAEQEMFALAAPTSFVGTVSLSTLTVQQASNAITASGTYSLNGSGIIPNTLAEVSSITTIIPAQTVGTPVRPVLISSLSQTASVIATGSIGGTSGLILPPGTGGVAVGQAVIGYGVLPNTSIASSLSTDLGTYALGVGQSVTNMALSTLANATVIAGSIAGTVLTVAETLLGNVSPTATQTILGQNIALGTSIVSGASPTFTLSVLQYASGNNTTLLPFLFASLSAGQVVGSVGNGIYTSGSTTTTTTILAAQAVQGSVAPGQLLSGVGLPVGSQVAEGSLSGPGTVTVSAPIFVPSESLSFSSSISASSIGSLNALSLNFLSLGARKGRVIEIYSANFYRVGGVSAFDAGTVVRLLYTGDARIDSMSCGGSQNNMTMTGVDIQGELDRIVVADSSAIELFTFINNNSDINTDSSSGLRLVGTRVGTSIGGTLINHQAGYLFATACSFGGGSTINIGAAASGASFSTTGFASSSDTNGATQFVYEQGAPQAAFDPSCVNVPASAFIIPSSSGTNAFGSSGLSLNGAFSAAIGGRTASDFGRMAYLLFPSNVGGVFGQPGNRQAGRTILGAFGSGDVTLTVDGLAIDPSTGNSLPLAENETFIASGYVAAKSTTSSDSAVWPDVWVLLTSEMGVVSVLGQGGNGTPAPFSSGGDSSTWTFSFGPGSQCVEVSAYGGTGTIEWICVLDCGEIT